MPLLILYTYINMVLVEIGGEDRLYAFSPYTPLEYSRLSCYNAGTGEKEWTVGFTNDMNCPFIGMAGDKSLIYAYDPSLGYAVGVDPLTGETLWSTALSASMICSVGPDDCAYYAGYGIGNDTVAKVSREGEVLWSRSLGRGGAYAYSFSWTAITPGNDALYGSQDTKPTLGTISNSWLIKLNPENGDELWAVDVLSLYGNQIFFLGLTALDEPVCGAYPPKLYCFNPDGSLKWVTSTFGSDIPKFFARDVDGMLYAGQTSGIWRADPGDGGVTHLHSLPTGEELRALAVGKTKRIYYGSYNYDLAQGYVRCLSGDGAELWSYSLPYTGGWEYIPDGIAVFRDKLFVNTINELYGSDGLFCFSP
jgi:outer membrane protein assembly factor BamB